MKNKLKPIASFILIIAMLGTFCITTFAATKSYKANAGYDYSKQLANVTCDYFSLKKDSVTVKNNGTTTLFMYVNGGLWKELRPGQSGTYGPTHHGKDYVKVFAKNGKPGLTHNFNITTTSGKIINN